MAVPARKTSKSKKKRKEEHIKNWHYLVFHLILKQQLSKEIIIFL